MLGKISSTTVKKKMYTRNQCIIDNVIERTKLIIPSYNSHYHPNNTSTSLFWVKVGDTNFKRKSLGMDKVFLQAHIRSKKY